MEGVVEALIESRCVAIVRARNHEKALARIVEMVVELGCRVVEITRDSDEFWRLLEQVVAMVGDKATVGVGTVLEASEIERMARIGAKFCLSPVNPTSFCQECLKHGVVAIPGCFTPQEMFNAHLEGAHFIKIFPAQMWTPEALKALRGVDHFGKKTRYLVTGGIDEHAAQDWFAAGASLVGMGALVSGHDINEDSETKRQEWLAQGRDRAKQIFHQLRK